MARVLVCGSRHFTDRKLLEATLQQFAIEEIIEGGAFGADTLAREWAFAHKIPVMEFMADWGKYGRAAGPLRNKRMLDEAKPDLVIAFMAKGSKGTKNMVQQAAKAGVKTHVVNI
jgi:hypothetical protein